MARILIFVTEDWVFCSHRLPLAVAAKNAGHEVVVLTRVRKHGEIIRSHGLVLVPIELSRRSKNVFVEVGLLVRLISIYRKVRPDLVHHVAVKPVLYGSIAAWCTGVPGVVNALTGLGYIFSSRHFRARLLRPWVRIALRLLLNGESSRVIVQNPDDLLELVGGRMVKQSRMNLIRGSGVDVDVFRPMPEPEGMTIILPARLLWDKGVQEFVDAARELKRRGLAGRFALVGAPDLENPGTVPENQLRHWKEEGVVEYWGWCNDMMAVLSRCHIVCLPSVYGEGLPKSLLEAAACGKAIVTTDSPGCREIVHDGDNGFLVPLRDSAAVAAALEKLMRNPDLRRQMGRRGRELAKAEFSIDRVVNQTLAVYKELL